MSIDRVIKELISAEVRAQLAPLQRGLAELKAQSAVMVRLAATLDAPLKRGPGRPKQVASHHKALKKTYEAPPRVDNADRSCAIIDCRRPARSKGYCAAHYQKYRMLALTHRLPSGWVDDARPQSLTNVVLPRGRAGAKALAEAKRE